MSRPAEYSFKVQIQEYAEWIFLNKKKLILFNLILLLLTVGVILFWPRQYRSEAKIWIKIGRENSHLDPTAATGETISIQENDREDEIKSVLDILASRGVVTDVVDTLGPLVVLGREPLPGEEVIKSNFVAQTVKGLVGSLTGVLKSIDPVSDREEAVQKILESVLVRAEEKSNVVSIVYDTKNPKLAQAVVNELVDQYTKAHGRIHSTAGSRPFFEEQLKSLSGLVADASEALRAEKDRIGLASINGQRMMLENQMMQAQAAKMNQIRNIAQSEASITKLEKQIEDEPDSIKTLERAVPNTGRDMIRDQLFALQVRRMELGAKLEEDHPLLEAIRQQEADAERELKNTAEENRTEVTRSINDIRQQLLLSLATAESRLVGQRASLDAIEKQEATIAKEIVMLNKDGIEIKRLETEVELAATNYRNYAVSLEDARMSEALDQSAFSNISVAQPATLVEDPVSPSKVLVAALGLFGMITGSIMIVVCSKILSGPALLPEEVSEAAEAPVLVENTDQRKHCEVLT